MNRDLQSRRRKHQQDILFLMASGMSSGFEIPSSSHSESSDRDNSSKPQHKILNTSYSAAPDLDLAFPQFSKLQPELRLIIWELAIPKQRLLEIELSDAPPSKAPEARPYRVKNALGNLISNRPYLVHIHGARLYSKFLRVNRESRDVALRFYRVHFPCNPRSVFPCNSDSVFYFSPSNDILHLTGECSSSDLVLDFLNDLRAYDPSFVGLLNLALDINSLSCLTRLVPIPDQRKSRHDITRDAVFETILPRLENVIYAVRSLAGRQIMGPLMDFRGVGWHRNRAMPFYPAASPSFTLLQRDPRMLTDVEKRYVLTAAGDPRAMRAKWREMLGKWDRTVKCKARERVLFACEPPAGVEDVDSIKAAERFMREEDREWKQAVSGPKSKRLMELMLKIFPSERPEDVMPDDTETAIGFWLVDADALPPLEGNPNPCSKCTFDLTGCWPELAIVDLY